MNRALKLACAGAASLSFLIPISPGKSQTMSVCPASGSGVALPANDGCATTPSRYEIVIYEMGLCTSNPTASSSFDRSTCTSTLISSGGVTTDLAPGSTVDLGSSGGSLPEPGNYSYAYIVMANTFGLNVSYAASNGTTYASNSSGQAIPSGTPTNFTETLVNFDGGGACEPTASASVTGGNLRAMLADGSLSRADSCTGVTRLVGTFEPSSPIAITSSTSGLNVSFTVTDNGATITTNNAAPPIPTDFNSGPFSPSFTVIE